MLNYYLRVPNFTQFCSTITRFPDNWGFWFLHKLIWWIWNFRKKKSLKIRNSNVKNSKRSFVRPNEKIIQEKFDKYWLQICRRSSIFWKSYFQSITSAPNDPKVTLNATRRKAPYICWTFCYSIPVVPDNWSFFLFFHSPQLWISKTKC